MKKKTKNRKKFFFSFSYHLFFDYLYSTITFIKKIKIHQVTTLKRVQQQQKKRDSNDSPTIHTTK